MKRFASLVCTLALGLATGLTSVSAIADDLVIHTDSGVVRGMDTGTMHAYLGIPYAAPPVGDLRWRAPRPPAKWHGVRNATQYAAHCPQVAGFFGQASATEDCLYLNVFTPDRREGGRDWDRDRGGLPVMVWIHGGALVSGESDDYDPTPLVAHDVIVVTINYRLGALGFLAHSALAADNPSDPPVVNYGLRDQQAALHWVQENIGRFGGNAHRVTVFGESAGGLSTLSHVVSPLSTGLLERAIVESGAYSLTLASLPNAEAAGAQFATAVGCSSQSADCLRAVPLSAILANQNNGGYTPAVDGAVLPQAYGAAIASGQFNHVPVMQGSNHDEWRLFVGLEVDLFSGPLTASGYTALVDGTYGPVLGPLVLAQYPVTNYPSPDLADGAVGTDFVFACSGRIANEDLSKYVPVFAYEFADPNAPQDFLPPVSFPYAAAHASELQYLFNLRVAMPHPGLSPAQQALSATMTEYWTRFAKDGNPNHLGVPYWPGYTATTDQYQSLIPGAVMPETTFAAFHQCGFWEPIMRGAGD